mgnify:CR=1 FL=1
MGRQAYVICPMVEESEGLEAENVTDYARKLQEVLPREISIEILHGKMKPKEKKQDHGGFCFRRDPGAGIYHSCGGWSECAKVLPL